MVCSIRQLVCFPVTYPLSDKSRDRNRECAIHCKKESHTYYISNFTCVCVQRHEEPKQATDEYEIGTYVYFDFNIVHDGTQSGWCYRLKQVLSLPLKFHPAASFSHIKYFGRCRVLWFLHFTTRERWHESSATFSQSTQYSIPVAQLFLVGAVKGYLGNAGHSFTCTVHWRAVWQFVDSLFSSEVLHVALMAGCCVRRISPLSMMHLKILTADRSVAMLRRKFCCMASTLPMYFSRFECVCDP